MADSFKYIARKIDVTGIDLTGTPLEGLDINGLVGSGFDGWKGRIEDLDVTGYEVTNFYTVAQLAPFYWNWYGFQAKVRAQIPLTDNEDEKESVDLHSPLTTRTSDDTPNRDPKDRVINSWSVTNFGSGLDNFDLEDLDSGTPNPDHDPSDPNSEFWLREPNDDAQCKSRIRGSFFGINTIYRCFSGGVFQGYSFESLGYVYAKASVTSGGDIIEFKQKLIGYYGLIEDIDDLIEDYDSDVFQSMQDLATVTTVSQGISADGGNTSINVTKLQSEADFISTGAQNTPEGNASFLVGIDDELEVEASLGSFTFHTYT